MDCIRHQEVLDVLGTHDERLRDLETAHATSDERVSNLIVRMDRLVETMEKFMDMAWKGLAAIATVGFGFIIWYIQKGA